MDQRRWQRVESLYHATREQPPEQRTAFLASECGDDRELREEVESLLDQDVSSDGGPLDRAAWQPHPGSASETSGTSDRSSSTSGSRDKVLTGSTLAHYQVQERLGTGGMGVVYKAEDTVLRRTVALKFLGQDAVQDDAIKERLIREAQAAAAFDHPNVCHVYGIHEAEGLTFVAMAFIDGPSLAERIKEGPLGWEEAVDTAIAVGDALQEAHEKGIVHRDVKPGNIMLTSKGQVKVMDFGLAKLTGRSKITKSGARVGTPAYMSPEQLLGREVDHRTDIWALGIALYEMLTQRTPFEADYEQAIAYGIIHVEPEPATTRRPDVPGALDRIMDKALAKEPGRRYSDAGEFTEDLRRLRSGSEGRPSGSSDPRSTAQWDNHITPTGDGWSRRKTIFGGTAALAVAGVGARYWFGTGSDDAPSASGRIESLAVLPFETSEPSGDGESLAEGLAEGLLIHLAQADGLRVLSRDAAFRYEPGGRDARTIAADLGVDAVLRGRIAENAGAWNISAEIVDASDGSVLWAARSLRRSADLLGWDQSAAIEIANRLDLSLTDGQPFQPVASQTGDPEAYRLYLLGRFHWNRRGDGLGLARDYFQQAVDLDPEYGLAWAGLANAYLMLGGWSVLRPGDSYPRAARAARRATELDPSLASPHATLGYVSVIYERDWTTARREFEQAVALDEGYASAHHWFAFHHMTVGDGDRALAEIRRAQELDPTSPIITTEVAYFLMLMRRYEESEQAARAASRLDPSSGYVHSLMARSFAARGMEAEARQSIDRALALSGDSIFVWVNIGASFAELGDSTKARQTLTDMSERAKTAYVSPQLPGMVHASLGEADQAFALFEESIAERSFIASWMRDPALDPIVSDKRFEAMMDGLGLQV